MSLCVCACVSHHAGSEDEQARIAADAFTATQPGVVPAVYCTDPDHAVHLFSKLSPLYNSATHINQEIKTPNYTQFGSDSDLQSLGHYNEKLIALPFGFYSN